MCSCLKLRVQRSVTSCPGSLPRISGLWHVARCVGAVPPGLYTLMYAQQWKHLIKHLSEHVLFLKWSIILIKTKQKRKKMTHASTGHPWCWAFSFMSLNFCEIVFSHFLWLIHLCAYFFVLKCFLCRDFWKSLRRMASVLAHRLVDFNSDTFWSRAFTCWEFSLAVSGSVL